MFWTIIVVASLLINFQIRPTATIGKCSTSLYNRLNAAVRRKPGFFDYARANGTKSTGASVSADRQSIGTALHTKLPDHRGRVRPSQAFPPSISSVSNVNRSQRDLGIHRVSSGSQGRKKGGVYEEIKSHRTTREEHHRDACASFRSYLGASERGAFHLRGRNEVRRKHVKGWWGNAKDEEPKRSRRERRDHRTAVR